MAPQAAVPLAATVLGTIGTVFWSIQLLPQIYFNNQLKDTEGMPALMMLLWAISAIPFGVYAIVQKFAIPLQVQPQIFCTFTLVCWGQIMRYHGKWKVWKAALAAAVIDMIFGGVELLLVLTLRGPQERGVEWPMTLIGIIAAILLAAGLLPPYFELWQRKGRVVGINFGFLTVDILGAFFSLMALVAQKDFDPLGSVLFLTCICLQAGIFASHAIWLLLTKTLHKRAKTLKVPFDALDESEQYRPPVLRRASIAFARGMSDGTLGQFHRRASMADALGDPERRATIYETRKSTLAKVNSTPMGGAVVMEEEEVSPDEGTAVRETQHLPDGSSNKFVTQKPKSVDVDLERQGSYGTIDPVDNSVNSKKKKSVPPPGRGESFFKDMNWK